MYRSLDLIVFLRGHAGILKIEKEEELNGKSKAGRFVRSLFYRASGSCDGCRDLSAGIGNLSLPQRPVQIINKSKHPLPAYATELSAGMDIRANLNEPISLAPMQRCLVPTGLYIALPEGFEAQVRPRSGLAIKKGITVLNSPGTIDADYRGEVCIILVNLSAETFVIEDGERIAQMVIARHEQALWQEVEVLDETERGAGGFGHTGKK